MTQELDYFQTVARWSELKDSVARLQVEERSLREGLFSGTFPNPQEGVNTLELPDGSKMKGTYKINRKLDDNLLAGLIEKGKVDKDTAESIRRIKVELDTKAYKELDKKVQKIVDNALEIKPSLPSLELVPPKNA